jgi:PST family polysaccharide transporter
MSVAVKAARGAIWTILSSMGGRAIGVIGTLIITRFLDPEAIGEVSVASIICLTATWLTTWGIGQYVIVRGRGDDAAEVSWHATVAYFWLGVAGLGVVTFLGPYVTPLLDAPHAAIYVPGMAIAAFIRRLGYIPERLLIGQMKFRAIGLSLFFGEASYTVAALALAALHYGGMSIVYANLIQSSVIVLITWQAAGFGWFRRRPLRRERFKDMSKFGVPLAVGAIAHGASRYWDNLTVSALFGPAATGVYNMAYNLADVPAIQIGEQIATVLLPSLTELPPDERAPAVERSAALLSLVLFPLAVGLALVAYPLISLILPSNKWQEVAPLLAILTSLSVFRPFIYVLSAYMEANGRTRRLMYLEVGKLFVMIGLMIALAPLGLRASASAVGISFGLSAIVGAIVIAPEGLSAKRLLLGFLQPLLACVVMAAAVLGAHRGLQLANIDRPAVELIVDIVVGAVAYVAAALVICRATSRDLLQLLKRLRKRSAST